VKALLDEQLSPRIAQLVRDRGHDVQAVGERLDLAGRSDRVILEVAATEERAVITNNVKDFRPLAAERLAHGESHAGLILLPSRRTRTRAAVEMLASAIDQILREHPDGLVATEWWIRPTA
jgi:predicted nuclease of predicted toxin-antitoxin system